MIAGGGVRAVLELAGIRDVLAKSLGTTNPINMAKATVDGLKSLRRPEDVAQMRGKTIAEILPQSAVAGSPSCGRDGRRPRPRRTPGADARAAPRAADEPEQEPAEAVTDGARRGS